MAQLKILFGFHAVSTRLKVAPQTVVHIYIDPTRRDARMKQFLQRCQDVGIRCLHAEGARLTRMSGQGGHQGVVAEVTPTEALPSFDHWLEDRMQQETPTPTPPLLLLLDGVTDPHNLGACLRVADGAGVDAVIAPKDHAVGLTPIVSKVASGAAEVIPYFLVTNLSRCMTLIKEHGLWIMGTADDAPQSLYQSQLTGPMAWVLGAEGQGLRALTRKQCDTLVHIPMSGTIESLNVSVASAICLFETKRQRH